MSKSLNRVNKIMAHLNPISPLHPKTCQECHIEKDIKEFRKYSKGISSDPLCLICRKIIEKQKRDDKKINPKPPKYPMEPTRKRGRPKKEIEEKQEIKEDVGNADLEFRTCEICGESKELNSDFYHRQKNGWNPSCKECKNKAKREKYKNDKDLREKKAHYQKEYSKEYYIKNKEKFKLYNKTYKEFLKIKKELEKEQEKINNLVINGIELLA